MTWMRQPRMHLAGTADERVAELDARAEALGWAIHRDPDGTRSTAWPFLRNVRLRRWAKRSPESKLGVTAHEFTHVRQWGAPWWRRWWRGLVYVASVKARVTIEIEARAHQAVAVADYLRARGLGFAHVFEAIASNPTLWGWAYLNPWGDGPEIKARTLARMAELDAEG